MSNARICVKNAVERAVLTVSPAAVATLPVANLANPRRGRLWRSATAAQQVISGTWNGSGYYVSFMDFDRFNLEPAATIRLQLYSDAAWTTQIYDSGTIAAYSASTLGALAWGIDPLGSSIFDSYLGQLFSVLYFARVLCLSFKLTVTDTGNSAGYNQASRLFMGDYTEFTYNPQYGSGLTWVDNGTQETLAGGSLAADAGNRSRHLNLDFKFIKEIERPVIADALRYAGMNKPIFFSMYPGEAGKNERDHTMICRIFGSMPEMSFESFQIYGIKVPLREI